MNMATKSFLKSVTFKDKTSAKSFVSALENADKKSRKKVIVTKKVETIKDSDKIKEIFKVTK